jgi:hypothetical protein
MKPFSVEYVQQEICRFRGLLGQKTFWELPECNRRGAIAGLTTAYFQMDFQATPEQVERVAMQFESALDEYTRREFLLLTHGLKIGV